MFGEVHSCLRNGDQAIFGVQFSVSICIDFLNKVLAEVGLPWEHRDHYRTVFNFNPACTLLTTLPANLADNSFPFVYSINVLYARNTKLL